MKKTAAVILAAGRSSRMGDFKPLLPFEGKPAIRFLVDKFIGAAIDRIIIVTGYRAEDIVKSLAGLEEISFIHNEDFETTDMFASVKLALAEARRSELDNILVSPVDLPLISRETVRKVLAEPGEIIIPRHRGRDGHPVKISKVLLESLENYRGEGGLKGALYAHRENIVGLPVEDPFIDADMDTKEDYDSLIRGLKKIGD